MIFELLTPLWLGILTSISPCPLATNIAAVSYIGKEISLPHKVLLSGIFYSIGRTISYILVGFIIINGMLSIPFVSFFLQKWMNIILGPLLIFIALFLLNVIKLDFISSNVSFKVSDQLKSFGLIGALLIGMIFALSFCPVSAGIFFGSLIPLALKANSILLYPLLYGVGTALPVIIFALLVSFGVSTVNKIFDTMIQFDRWAKIITAIIFILAGVYLILTYIFKLQLNIF